MHATNLLQQQLNGINSFFHTIADDLTDSEWTDRALPGTNLLGFALWHNARTQDCVVQTLIRGIPTVAVTEHWINRNGFATPGIGDTFTLDEADQLTRSVSRPDVIAYTDSVHRTFQDWLETLTDEDLDLIPDVQANYDRVSYPDQHPSLFGKDGTLEWARIPIWKLLTGECIMHVRNHLVELDMLKRLVRQSAHH